MADLNVGSTFVTLDARTDALEGKLRRAGALTEQVTAKMDRDAKRAGAAVSGIGAGRTNDGSGRAVVTGTIPGVPAAQAAAGRETSALVDRMFPEFRDMKESLRRIADKQTRLRDMRGGFDGGDDGGDGFLAHGGGGRYGRSAREGSTIGQIGAIGTMLAVAKQAASYAFDTGQQIGEKGRELFRSGAQSAELDRLIDKETDPSKRAETLRKQLEDIDAMREGQRRRMDRFGVVPGYIANAVLYGNVDSYEKTEEYAEEKRRELRNVAGAAAADRRRRIRGERAGIVLDQQLGQSTGQFSPESIIVSMETNTQAVMAQNAILERIAASVNSRR